VAPIALLLVLGLIPAAHAQSEGAGPPKPPGVSAQQPAASAARSPAAATSQRATASSRRAAASLGDDSPAPRAAGATTLYHAVLPDGSTFVGDRPPEAAQSVRTLSYPFPQGARIEARAEARRQYWREQAEAFNERQRERDREAAQQRQVREMGRSLAKATPDVYCMRPVARRDIVFAPPGYVPVPPVYTSTPGAVRGRDSRFIGSGLRRAD
jgi:hypothetical protein